MLNSESKRGVKAVFTLLKDENTDLAHAAAQVVRSMVRNVSASCASLIDFLIAPPDKPWV